LKASLEIKAYSGRFIANHELNQTAVCMKMSHCAKNMWQSLKSKKSMS